MAKKEGTFWIDEDKNELVLKDEKEEKRFFVEEELKIDDKKYLILVSIENEHEEAIALKLLEDEDTLAAIEDDEEFELVKEKYMAK